MFMIGRPYFWKVGRKPETNYYFYLAFLQSSSKSANNCHYASACPSLLLLKLSLPVQVVHANKMNKRLLVEMQLLCLTPDDFTRQGERTGTYWLGYPCV